MEHKTLPKSVLKSYLPEEAQSSYGDIVDLYYRELGDYTDEEFLELNSEEIDELKKTVSKIYNLPKITFNDVYVLNHILKYELDNDTKERKALKYATEMGSLNYVKSYFNEEKRPITDETVVKNAAIKNDKFDIVEYIVALRVTTRTYAGHIFTGIPPFYLQLKHISPEMRQFLKDLRFYYTGEEL